MALPLLLLIIGIWVVAALLLVALCRCAAHGDAVAHERFEHLRAAHWGQLDR